MALSLEGVEERAHMGHPDFRVGGKIFATLGYPDTAWGMVKLTPEQQRAYVMPAPEAFQPASGAWGLRGATMVDLRKASADAVRDAMREAWLGAAAKKRATKKKSGR